MADQISLRRETNLYDDETIKAVNDKVTSQYAVSTTPSNTVAKTATVDGDFTLYKNARVSVFFQNANTSTSPTLNVAGTGAKPIWAYGGPLSADGNTFNWVANSTIEFVYDGEHWLVADSGAVGLISKYDEKLTQEAVFNKLTNNGEIRGIFMKDGQMYINMDYLQTGTLKLGGANNGNGLLVVYNAAGDEIGRWDKDGLSATGNLTIKNSYISAFVGTNVPLISDTGNQYTGTAFAVKIENNGVRLGQYAITLSGSMSAPIVNEKIFCSGAEYNKLITVNSGANSKDTIWSRVTNSMYYIGYGRGSGSEYAYVDLRAGSKVHAGYENGRNFYYPGVTVTSSNISIGCNSSVGLFISSSYYEINGRTIQLASSSSKRYKNSIMNIKDESLDIHKLYLLDAKQFKYNDDYQKLQYGDMKGQIIPGFIAEDVAEIYPAAVIHDADGNIESWDERRIIPGMLALIQEQKKQLDEQAERIKKLESNTSFIHMV